jgi:hypothetical protein
MISVGDILERPRKSGGVERALVEKVRTSGNVLINGSQVAATSENPVVTARIVVLDGESVLKTRATRTFVHKMHGDDHEMGVYTLVPRQKAMYEMYEAIVGQMGQFDKSVGGNGAHYADGTENVFLSEGMQCANCVFYCGGRACEVVAGDIDPLGICKLWIIAEPLLGQQATPVLISERELGIEKASNFTPPQAVRDAAQRAVKWIEEGKAGDGFTAVGAGRARDLAAGRAVSLETVKRISNFLSRHEVDKKAEGFSQGENGYPSAGRVAWDAWGGDPAKSWVSGILADVQKAAKLKEGQFVRWNSSGGPAQGRIEHVMEEGTLGVPNSRFKINAQPDDPAVLIRIYQEGADGWVETPTLVGHKASTLRRIEPLSKATRLIKQATEERFTLAPWYIPEKYDAQNEWTDARELQKALWEYVQSGDRTIRLQHNKNVRAGEWVEAMTLPHSWTTPMTKANGATTEITYPAGTVLLGVIWDDWAWDMVKKGEITGFSIGGSAERLDLEMP